MKNIRILWLCTLLVFNSFIVAGSGVGGDARNMHEPCPVLDYVPHAPIRIDSNADFPGIASSGNGTEADPWIIEGWDINGTGAGDCIYIGNTTRSFIIRDCYLHDAGGLWNLPYFTWADVGLNNVGDGRVTNNTGSNGKYGVHMYSTGTTVVDNNSFPGNAIGVFLQQSSMGNVLVDNVISDSNYGIAIYGSLSNMLARNTISNSTHGIHVYTYGDNTLDNNTVMNNTYGIYLHQFSDNVLSSNVVINNLYGIFLEESDTNTLEYNVISDNEYGIYLNHSISNVIHGNDIINNTCQAYDNTGTNRWNASYPVGGNYWSDYTGIDVFSGTGQNGTGGDGIGDIPYQNITGNAGAQDDYPLIGPWGTPPPLNYYVPLEPGWNLISVPLTQSDTRLCSVLGSIVGQYDAVKYYDTMDTVDHWKSNVPYRSDNLNDLSNIDLRMGFWLHMNNSANLTVPGTEPVSTGIPLYAGWNLVGYPTLNSTVSLSDALWGTGADRVEVCDPAEPYLVRVIGPTHIMQPGEGYWVHVPADTMWTVDW